MALRAKKPDAMEKRLKLMMFGAAGVGKTTAALNFPKPYIIDTERGSENYDKSINAVGGAVFQTTDIRELVSEVKSLLTEEHDYLTLVIDPITTVYQDLLERAEALVGSDFGRHYGEANKQMRRLVNLIMALDMNVIITSHAKDVMGANMTVSGKTFDGWKRLDYIFDLVIELRKEKDKKRVGHVHKTRIDTFTDGETFPWSWDEIKRRYPVEILERHTRIITLATPAQIRELNGLLDVVKLPDGMVEKWLDKAKAETFEDMPADTLAKCIEFVRGRLPGGSDTPSTN